MASDVAPIEKLAERPMGIEPADIEAEFSRIWRETSGAGFDESSIRLRVLNMVGLARSQDDADAFEAAMQVLPQRHPCRGILAISLAGSGELHASICAHCWRSVGGRRHVCSEEVVLTGEPADEPALASAVLALLVPEVPVALWSIDGSLADSYLLGELLSEADRMIFDSGKHDDPARTWEAALRASDAHGILLNDLAWGRTETWRTLTAQMFDGEDGPRELATISAIEIRGGVHAPSAEALLTAAWLVSRLRLAPADGTLEGDVLDATLYRGLSAVRLTVRAGASTALQELRIKTADAEFSVQWHEDSGHMHLREEWDGGSSRRAVEPLPNDDATVIALALDTVAGADVYEQAARAALALLAAAR